MTLAVIEKNDEIITIEKIENGMEIGYVQKKKCGKLDMEKYHFMRNIEPLWFSENSISIFKKLGIDTTFQRARDFTNLLMAIYQDFIIFLLLQMELMNLQKLFWVIFQKHLKIEILTLKKLIIIFQHHG